MTDHVTDADLADARRRLMELELIAAEKERAEAKRRLRILERLETDRNLRRR